ncbi:amino acid adenylation domain-containing protein [Nonomuraea sp. NBC_01738]|uniref:non-ribosomal peptide synthetase n=1 Tax=Nonomuraea sp. NBC_01738 TaxID=2976003 RepID=UPI002E10066E|nr:non-ribosomal peptide synthetase [Nonomuraea sp. NBC_01738]WSG17299.1 amino acid adenylation domain-containing protein [Nonomuraea sp. NBC_01738]
MPLPTYPFERRRFWITPGGRRLSTADEPAHRPLAEGEDAVGAAWQEVLGLTPSGPGDDFFELGGDSLMATQLASRLGLPIEAVFDNPTVAGQRFVLATPVAAITASGLAGPAPVSFTQRRIWFIDQVHGTAAYTVATALDLRGRLDEKRMRAAVQELVRRHAVLRTAFPAPDGEPVQEVREPGPVPLPVVTATAGDAERVLREDARRPFDLEHGPPFRATLLRLGREHHIVSLVMHHIVADGWSLTVLCRELAALYNGAEPAEPAIGFADYARWQREHVRPADLEYWTRRLRGAPHSVDLPADRPRPPQQTFDGAVATRTLPAGVVKQVRALAQERGATLYMTVLAALHTLLFRYSGQGDLSIGSPVAGRTRAELEGVVGCFMNTLVMRAEVAGDQTFGELLAQVRENALGAYAHQDVPFERLVEELNPPRDLSRNPLFQVLFNLLNLPGADLGMDGLQVAELAVDLGTSQVDLALYAYEQDEDLLCRLEYNTALYDAGTAERMLGHLERLLAAVAADPALRLADIDFLADDELDFGYDALPVPALCVHELVEAQADRTPDAVAMTFAGESVTYRELDERANGVAHSLRERGAGPGTLVGLSLERSLGMFTCMLGVLKAGAAYVPLDPMYPEERRQYIREHSGIRVVLTDDDLPGFVPNPDRVATGVQPGDLAYVLYTSGSTGRPKGVRVMHASVVNFLTSMAREPGLDAGDTLVAVTTFAFDISVLELFLPLTVGGHVVIADRETSYDPVRLAALMTGATVMQATPATWRLLISSGWEGLPGLKALCGGEALPPDLARDLAGRVGELWNLYGPTETTIWSTLTRVERDVQSVTIGHPIANTTVHLLDAAMQRVPVGVVGELYIGGAGLARDYLGRPDLTAQRFVADPHGEPGSRLYRTGDLARRRADGSIEFLGRADGQVKVRGYRIELGEIEALLLRHDAVREAAAVVRDEAIVAYLAADGEHDWREYLRRNLPDYMVPSAFVALDALPLTPNGKVDRKALPAPERQVVAGGTAPRTPAEVRLAELWSQVLGLESVGIDDDFFELGGDSFKAVRAVRDTGGSVLGLFKHPTIRDFAAHAGTAAASGGLFHELTGPREASITLVAVPFAGGGAITYQPLAAALPGHIRMLALEPPGHDTSRPEEAALPFGELAAACVEEIGQRVTGPVVLYGHCMGGALTVDLARRLEAAGVELVKVYIGGHFPSPRLPGKAFAWARRLFPMERWTSKRRALEFLRAMGFFTESLSPGERDFLMEVFLRDTQEGEDYYTELYDRPIEKLASPVVCVVGENDRATELHEERYREWEAFSDSVSLHVIPKAGHYFQKHQAPELGEILGDGRPPVPPPPRFQQASLKRFFLVAFGQLVSLIGTGLTTFGLGLWVYRQTGSIAMFALMSVLALLPAVVLAPIAGAVADRFDRKTIMITADSAAGVASAGLAVLLWSGGLELWHVYVIVTTGAISTAFHQPAYMAAVAQLVPKRYYGRANGLAQLGQAAGTVFAPLLGGALVAAVELPGIIVVDLVSFLFAVTVTLLIRFPDTLFKKREETFGQEVLGGWRYIARRHGLLAIIAFTSVLNFMFAMVEVLATPLVLSLTDSRGLGLVLACTGVGLLAGSVLMSVTGGLERRTNGIMLCFGGIGVSMMIIGSGPHPALPAIGLFCLGFSTAVLNAHWFSIVQQKVGLDLQGRVIATNLMLVWLMVPAGFLAAGPLAEHVFEPLAPGHGIGLLMIVAGLFTIVLGVIAFRYRPVRFLEDDLPDAIPDAVAITDKDLIQRAADQLL